MKLRKLMALITATVVFSSSLAGCGNNTDKVTASKTLSGVKSTSAKQKTGEKVNIKLFTGKIETIDVMNEIIDSFNASQDHITVEQEYQKDASNVIKIKFASNEVPDIMTTYEQGFVDEGKYMDLSDLNQFWNRMSPDMKTACTDVNSGKVYRICTNMTMAGFFYNKNILKSAGYDKFPEKWDDFENMLKAIKNKNSDVTPWFIFGSEGWHLGHLIEFLPHGYIKSSLGTVEAKKAFLANDKNKLRFGEADGPMTVFAEKMINLQNNDLINSDVLTATNDNCVQDFVNDKAAMFSNGMWALSGILEANPNIAGKIGFSPYPAYMPNSKPVVLSAEDSGYCISATTEHKDECIEFLNFLFSPENQKKYSEVAKAPSAFTDVKANRDPEAIVKEVDTALKDAANIGFTNEKPAGFSGDDAGRMMQELLAGQYTPVEFGKAYEKAWTDGMSR